MLTLTLIDEVNCLIEGLRPRDINTIVKRTELPVPGAFATAAYKTGNWSGKESLFRDDGLFFQYMIPDILDVLEELGYKLDRDVTLVDERNTYGPFNIPPIDEDFLKKETGFSLRAYQQSGINEVIKHQKGFLDFATNAGKSTIILGISKAFDPYLGSLIVVPSETLVKQTFEYYKNSDLNAVAITKKIKPKDRPAVFEQHRHIVITSKLLLNCLEYVDGKPYAFIYDESHIAGDVIFNAMRTALAECPVRVGLTGTMPSDRLKRAKIHAHIGGGTLDVVSAKQLIDNKFASDVHIDMIKVRHRELEELSINDKDWDWEKESRYLATHLDRIKIIADYIKDLETKNTLVLCHPDMGKRLSTYFNDRMIVDETPVDTRAEWFAEYDFRDDVILHGSFGCASTGISVDRIKRLILIDIGKNATAIKQSIGRGLRLDGETNELEVLDISSLTKYSERHYKERKKIYKREKFSFKELDYELEIK